MQRTARQRRVYLAGIPLAVGAFFAGILGAMHHGFDLRYLYATLMCAAVVGAVMALGGARRRPLAPLLLLAALAALAAGFGVAASVLLVRWLRGPAGSAPGLPLAWHLAFALAWAGSNVVDAAAWPTSPVTAGGSAPDA